MVMKGWQKMNKYFKYYGGSTLLYFAFVILKQIFKKYDHLFLGGGFVLIVGGAIFLVLLKLRAMGILLDHLQR